MTKLRCLALDVDAPALAEVAYLLDTDHRVATVQSTRSIADAADIVRRESIDAVFVCLVHHTVEQANRLVAEQRLQRHLRLILSIKGDMVLMKTQFPNQTG